MILSRSGSPNVGYATPTARNLQTADDFRTKDDSSPCWSPDGQWICFATKMHERRVLAKVPAGGGTVQRIPLRASPTRPNRTGRRTANGSRSRRRWATSTSASCRRTVACATVLVSGEHPSWSPNSRTLIFMNTRHAWAAIRCLCLTFSRNRSRILAGFRAMIPNPLGRNNFGSDFELKYFNRQE